MEGAHEYVTEFVLAASDDTWVVDG